MVLAVGERDAVKRTMSRKVTSSGKALLTSLAVECLGRCVRTQPPCLHWRLLHLRFTSISTRNVSHIPRRGTWRLSIIEGFSQSRFHLEVWVRWVCVDGVVHGTRFSLHCGLIQLRVLQVLLMKLCFCGGGCSGCRILAVQDGRDVHDPTRRSAADRGQGQVDKLPADSDATRAAPRYLRSW